MRFIGIVILSLLVYLNSFFPNSYAVNYTFPYSCVLLYTRKNLISNSFQPIGTTLPEMDDFSTKEYQPTMNDLPTMEYQPTTNNQPTNTITPTIQNQLTKKESTCKVKVLTNFPQIPYKRKSNLKLLIANQWKIKKDMDYFNCYTFDFLNQRESQEFPTLYEVVLKYQVNNTIVLMFTDKGYMNNLVSSYYSSKLYLYSNLIVVCGDIECYHVLLHYIFQ